MHDNKLGIGICNLDAGVSVGEIIRTLTGFTQENARRFSWNEVDPMIDCDMVTELCTRQHSDKKTWNRLVERVNKRLAYDLYRQK